FSYICLSRDNSALWRRFLETGTHRVRPQAGTTCTKALSVEPSNFRLVVAALARSDWRYRKGKIAKFLEGGEAIRRFYPTGCRKDTLLRVDPVCLKEFSAKQRTQSSSHRRPAFFKGSCGGASANASILTRLVVRGDEGSLRRTLKRTGTQLSIRDRICMVLDDASGPILVEWASPSGDTALHVASRYGHLALAERVMACLNNEDTAKAFANRRNLLGETAAHVALDCNHAPIAMMLVDKYGCNTRLADQAGRTVMSLLSKEKAGAAIPARQSVGNGGININGLALNLGRRNQSVVSD
ncbi:hypothetical protein FOZ63_005144, partial [Perkinsus olseni]